VRRPLPDHLTREEIVHHPGSVCPGCGGTRFSKIGEDVTEVLEKIPARLKVIRHIRPKLSCRSCERIAQAPTPDLPIEKGRPGPGLVANVVVGKYLDGLPLYRQSAILAREGIAIERATLADWVGHVAWWVVPLAELIGAQVMAAPVIHTDDTPIAVLAPGNGKTRTGRLWAYVVDERPWQGVRLPAAYYRFSPDRRGERPRDHLAGFRGVIQADAFSGYEALARSAASARGPIGRGPPRLIHAACWAHARRKFYDVFEATKSPLAGEALKRIGELCAIEAKIAGQPAEARLVARQNCAVPILDALHDWLTAQRRRLSSKNALARAMQYALGRWEALMRYAGDGRLAIDNNVAERALRTIATIGSFCAPSSSICKHCNLIFCIEVTRASFTPHRSHDALALEVGGADLVGRSSNNLLGGKHTSLDQPSNTMACNPAVLGGFSHCQPGAVLLSGAVGVDAANSPDRADPMSSPGLTLTSRQSHTVQRGGNILVRPAGRHAADDGQRIVRRAAVMLARARLAEPELRVLPALPMDGENDLAGLFIEVSGDLVDQRSQQLLTRAHR
jgi:transposase